MSVKRGSPGWRRCPCPCWPERLWRMWRCRTRKTSARSRNSSPERPTARPTGRSKSPKHSSRNIFVSLFNDLAGVVGLLLGQTHGPSILPERFTSSSWSRSFKSWASIKEWSSFSLSPEASLSSIGIAWTRSSFKTVHWWPRFESSRQSGSKNRLERPTCATITKSKTS